MFRTFPLSFIRSFLLYTQQYIQVCCVYGEKLLKMDRGTVRNMYSFMPKNKFWKLLHLVGFITWTTLGEQYRSLSSSFCSSIHYPVTSFLGPNIFPCTLFSHTLSPCSSLSVSDHVSHPYWTTRKTVILYNLIHKFLDSKLEDKTFCTEW